MKKKLLCMLMAFVAGCSVVPRAVLTTEKALVAGSEALDLAVDARIEWCRAQDLPTPTERFKCIEEVSIANDTAEPLIHAAVLAIRAYWAAKAAGNKEDMIAAVSDLRKIISGLPKDYFKGIQ